MSAVQRRQKNRAKKICRCSVLLVIVALFFVGCAVQQRPGAIGQGTFHVLPGKYEQKALDYEVKELFPEAMQSWSIVLIFYPDDQKIKERINMLRQKSRARAEEHFHQGVTYFQSGRLGEARREFLRTLAYDQNHAQALGYVKKRLQHPVFKTYTVQPGDTLQKIADKELQDPGKVFFITAFNTIDPSRQLPPGTQLQIPLLGKDFLQKKELVRVAPQNNAMSVEPQAQGLKKKEKKKTTIAVSLDSMAEEMAPATDKKERDAPDDSITYQKAKELLSRKEYHKSLQLLRSVDSSFRDVGRLIAATEALLQQEADAHYRQGISYFLSEDLDKAIVEWEEALRLWPTHLKAQKDLRNVRKMQQRMNQ